MFARNAIAAVLTFFLAVCAHSEAMAARRAFVMGIDSYEKVPKLTRAQNDAKAVASLLQELKFDVVVVNEATRAQFQKSWLDFLNSLQADDTVLFYFAGHGIQIDGSNYLLHKDTPDASKGEGPIRNENIDFIELMARVEVRGPKVAVYILDACRENPFGKSARGNPIGKTKGLARQESVFGTFVMYSAGTDEQALDALSDNDKDPNSVYTRALLRLLRDKELSLLEIVKRIQVEVAEEAKSKATHKGKPLNHQQRPAYFDGILGHYNLATGKSGSGLLTLTEDEWRKHPRVMYMDARSQWDSSCNARTPPKVSVEAPPQFGRIIIRTGTFTVNRQGLFAKPGDCLGARLRMAGIYYVIDEEHIEKRPVETARVKVNYFLSTPARTVTIDYNIDVALRRTTFKVNQ